LIVREISRYCGVERLACSHMIDKTLGLARTTVVHPPIDLAKYRDLPSRAQARAALGLPNDGLPVVALVGRILRWKGQDRFIRIAARVLLETDAHFAIVGGAIFGGDPDYPQELHALVDRELPAGRIHFVPWQEDMRNVYAAIDIACNCSIREPFGLTTVEALACEVPVVCFDDAGVCEIFEQHRGGIKVPAGDEHAFAAALLAYLRDPAGLSRARAHAREAAERLDVDRLCGLFIDVVSRVGAVC
jgi:glycosyltransferase involved in cell wall biosynthesis